MNELTEIQSGHSFGETLERLQRGLREAGNTIFAVIDQAAAAAGAGLTLRPTVLVVFGNPAAGTGLMAHAPLLGLALPLKAMVWDDGTVHVAYEPLAPRAAHFGATELVPKLEVLDAKVIGLLAAVAGGAASA